MASSEVWGIDIGKSALKAVKMRRIKDQVEIIGIDIIEYEQSGDAENEDKDEQIQQALIEFQTRNKLKNEKIYVSIPGQATFNRMITIPPVEAKRVKEIVTFEAQQQIPFPIEEVLWDYQLIGDKGDEEREVMLFAVRREIINNFLANLSAAQINVSGIQIAPLALYNFIRFERPDYETCVVVDIGAENTDLVVVDREKLWLRALPSAGNDITKALQKRFNIPYEEAEKLKLKSGKTKQAKKIFEVMKPVMKDIVGEIHRSVGYYKSMAKEIKFQKMILLGNVTKLAGFEKFFSQNLQYDIAVLSDVQNIIVSPKINVNLFQTNITTFGVAMGLAIQALGLSVNKIRLLPEEVWKKSALKKQKPVLAAAVLMLIIIPLWLWLSSRSLLNSINTTLSDIKEVMAPIQKKEQELKSAQDYGKSIKELRSLTHIGQNRDVWLDIFSALNKAYLGAAKKNQETKKGKIWILDTRSGRLTQKIRVGEKKFKDYDYIQTDFQMAFTSLEDPVKNRDYVLTNFLNPILEQEYRGRKLFDSKQSSIQNIQIKDTLFPGDAPRGKNYCHVTFQMIAWLDMQYTLTLPLKFVRPFNDNEVPDGLAKVFKENNCTISEFPTIRCKRKEEVWEIIDGERKKTYLVIRKKEALDVYMLDSK